MSEQDTGAPPVVETTPERPAWLPEKFKSPEDMAKSYTELERKLSQKKAAEGNGDLVIEKTPATAALPETAEAALAQAGLTLDEVAAAVAEGGKPTDEQYAKLQKVGFPKYVVDEVVQARSVLATTVRDTVIEAAGGDDGFTQLRQWAAANASKEAIAAFNRAVQGTNAEAAREQVELMMLRYEKANGTAGSRPLIKGEPAPGRGGGFTSYEEKRQAAADVQSGKLSVDDYNRRFAMTDPKFYHPPRRP